MKHILDIVKHAGIDCLACDRVNLDIARFAEYRDSDEHPAEALFERPPLPGNRKRVVGANASGPTILRYFLDGSRRTYKVADVILDGHYLPLVAGQVGVAVMLRHDDGRRVEPVRKYCQFRNVLAFPDRTNADDLAHIQDRVNEHSSIPFEFIKYDVKPERDPVDLGVARVMKCMQDLEVDAVAALSGDGQLHNDSMLVVDGPLRFKEMRSRAFNILQFRNVVGLSKTFRPSFTVGKGRHQESVGAITFGLAFGERTSVFRTTEDDKTIGMWYLRLRLRRMADPLQGIVKMECYALEPADKEQGLDADRVDTISHYVLRERNVTPYGADSRWASHIYPVFMAESYLKASFLSDVRFKALF